LIGNVHSDQFGAVELGDEPKAPENGYLPAQTAYSTFGALFDV
jgi:hypothetical protein